IRGLGAGRPCRPAAGSGPPGSGRDWRSSADAARKPRYLRLKQGAPRRSTIGASMPEATIWEHVSANVPKNAPGIEPAGLRLPDSQDDVEGDYVPGSVDGVRIVNRRVKQDAQAAEEIADLMSSALVSRKPKSYERLYERLCISDPLTYLDTLVEELVP